MVIKTVPQEVLIPQSCQIDYSQIKCNHPTVTGMSYKDGLLTFAESIDTCLSSIHAIIQTCTRPEHIWRQ